MKPKARSATSATEQATHEMIDKTEKGKGGVAAGCRKGETRVTCVMSKGQTQILHDFAKANGRTFREVCMAMADRYIDEVIKPYVEDGHKLRRQAGASAERNYSDPDDRRMHAYLRDYYADGDADLLRQFDPYAR